MRPRLRRAPTGTERQSALLAYRDDGPLSHALGGVLAPAVRLPPVALVLAGLAPLLVAVALNGTDLSRPAVAGLAVWLLLTAGISSGRPHEDRLRWAVPPVLRVAEYALVLWFAALAGPEAVPAAFALIAAVAFRHYDLVYRLRQRGQAPPTWVRLVGGGWDGRIVVAYALLATGALPEGFYVAALLLAVVSVGESVAGWLALSRMPPSAVYEDEEDEGQ